MNQNIIKAIVMASKWLYDKEMVNSLEGNISIKSDGLLYITPGRVNKSTLSEKQVCVIDNNDSQIFGSDAPSSELMMHQAVYEIRGGSGAVIHSHPPCLTAFALCGVPVESRATPEFIAYFGGCIKVAKYGRPGTLEVVEDALRILKEDDIVLLANHGVLSYGANIEDALNLLEAAEGIAKNLCIARMIGKDIPIPNEEFDFFLNMYTSRKL